MSVPDVTVVLPVYNAMPYLTRCLASLAAQTIGADRMEVVAVDDGSTDLGHRHLDRFARRFAGRVTVLRQPNSGGPAAPCNRALDRATGRYVFFLGADDQLGPEALERLVAAADRYDAEVVLGRVVGVNSRFIHQEVFAATRPEIGLDDPALSWSLANTKLFRRDLIERYGLRYPEDMPIGSDQPFTLAACHHARRVSVLADYDYYFAVRRLDARNITYLSRAEERLACAEALVAFADGLIGPGPARDTVLTRYFALEVGALLADDFLRLDRTTQAKLHAGVRTLAERHLSARIAGRLAVETRLRLAVARHGGLDDLVAVIRQDAERGVPPVTMVGDRWYATYPGFGPTADAGAAGGGAVGGSDAADGGAADGAADGGDAADGGADGGDVGGGLPDQVFDVTDALPQWLAKLDVTSVGWARDRAGRTVLAVHARSPLPDLDARASTLAVLAEEVPGGEVQLTRQEAATSVTALFEVAALVAASAVTGQRRAVRVEVTVAGDNGSAPLRATRLNASRPVVCRRGRRLYAVSPSRDDSGRLMISVVPLTPRRVVARLAQRR
ncbi:glycosyltransferase family 2 protein [Micromonospora cathayae]|uniref:Glycosyltransferase family 2 protein n=1 Tax=Micromonospora cathayae TaxID=3028804 RepID=A0ABY7ZQA5_9ACTN|nr:glycosyltransferase family 2 protein [Micromonospora sp. HUAS 3]WDZ85080.1 glycosyltransferase family 2 protein [Micromonospora sp. HUAS 3]